MPNPREEVLRRIEKKRLEISSFEIQIKEANSYIQALEEMLKILPKDLATASDEAAGQSLRVGSVAAKAREAILEAGYPLHINDILVALGKSNDNTTRAAVSGTISAYYRKDEIFTRPAPNTFGLKELGSKPTSPKSKSKTTHDSVPPPNFGLDVEETEDFELESESSDGLATGTAN